MTIPFRPADDFSVGIFVLLCVGLLLAFVVGARRAQLGLGVPMFLFLGLGALALVVSSGWLEAQPMPRVPLLFASINLAAVVAALSRIGERFSERIPLVALAGFQVFRLPLELILHSWANQGTLPTQMTWTGENFDILTGLFAIPAAIGISKASANSGRRIGLAFNSLGLLLLINVGRVAMFTSPLPFAWAVEPKLALVFHLPYAMIGPVCVGGALFGHLVMFRALLRESKAG